MEVCERRSLLEMTCILSKAKEFHSVKKLKKLIRLHFEKDKHFKVVKDINQAYNHSPAFYQAHYVRSSNLIFCSSNLSQNYVLCIYNQQRNVFLNLQIWALRISLSSRKYKSLFLNSSIMIISVEMLLLSYLRYQQSKKSFFSCFYLIP